MNQLHAFQNNITYIYICNLQNQIKKLQDEVQFYKQTKQNLDEEIQQLKMNFIQKSKYVELQRVLEQLKKNLSENSQAIQFELLEKRYSDLKAEYQALEQLNQQLKMQHLDKDYNIQKLKDDNKNQKQEIENEKKKLNQLKVQYDMLEKKVHSLLESRDDQTNKLTKELLEKEKEISCLRLEVIEQKNKLDNRNQDQEINQLKIENGQLRSILFSAKEEKMRQKLHIERISKDLAIKELSIHNLQQELQEKQRQLKKYDEQLKTINHDQTIIDQFIEQHKQMINQFMTQPEAAQKILQQWQLRADQIMLQLIEKRNQVQLKAENRRSQIILEKKYELVIFENRNAERGHKSQLAKNFLNREVSSYESINICFLLHPTKINKEETRKSLDQISQILKILTHRCPYLGAVCLQELNNNANSGRNIIYQPFSQGHEQLINFLQGTITAADELTTLDVRGAIHYMCGLEWRSKFKIAFLITGSPCHGRKYNQNNNDRFPDEELIDAIKLLITKEIILVGIQFTQFTLTMFEEIKQIFQSQNRLDLYQHFKVPNFTKSFSEHLTERIQYFATDCTKLRVVQTFSKDINEDCIYCELSRKKNLLNFENNVQGQTMESEFQVFRVKLSRKSLMEKIEAIGSFKEDDFKLYDQGNERFLFTWTPQIRRSKNDIYIFKNISQRNEQRLYIVKSLKNQKPYETLGQAIKECRLYLIAQALLKVFQKELSEKLKQKSRQKTYLTVKYPEILILQQAPNAYWLAERYYSGSPDKYNNNYGYIIEENSELNEIAQTFSYWTFVVSNRNYMICNIQAIQNNFVGPTVCTKDGNYDSCDFGIEGIKMFLARLKASPELFKEIASILDIN